MNTGAYDVLSEHQHIRRMVDSIEASLAKRVQGDNSWLDELSPVLDELATGLVSHFKGEEAELFADVSERLPRYAPTVEQLVAQHARLSAEFGQVANRMASLDVDTRDAIDEFATVLTRSLTLLRAHEEQENELMLAAYWQDLGEAD